MTQQTLLPTALLLAFSTCLLTACGGGSMVRPQVAPASLPPIPPPSPPAPPPPPPPPPAEPCLSPVTADCVVSVSSSASSLDLTGGRQSDHALIKRGDGVLNLVYRSHNDSTAPPIVDFRFGGGTTVEAGSLLVYRNASLHSNILVQATGRLDLDGATTGNLANHGNTVLGDTVTGNVVNDGILEPGSSIYGDAVPAHIEGNFSQAPNGTLKAVIGATSGGFISVSGRADIDGTLQLVRYADSWGSYPLPGTPMSLRVLHADGGVFGQFAQWTSPGLFITGAPRYLPTDVYFDIAAISAARVMAAAHAGDALTLGSAAHFDAAIGNSGTWAKMPDAALSSTQRQFLASAGAIQHLQDYDQAVRTFDSLSGRGYAAAADALLQHSAMPAPELMARTGNLHPGSTAGSWATPTTMTASGIDAFRGQSAGFDQWLGDRLLLGYSFGWSEGSLRFDRASGTARDKSPQWNVYWRRNGEGNAYTFGDLGYGRHRLSLDRQIDLGAGRQAAGAQRSLDLMHAYLEAGRDFRVGQTRLTSFAALSYSALHGAAFVEQGSSGFELIAQPSMQQRFSAAAGMRLGQEWHASGGRWTTLNLTAGFRHLLHAGDDARAAFAGAPSVTFALDGMPRLRNSSWLQMNLATGGTHWDWRLAYDRQASNEALSVGANFRF